eukprot:TRINITY_DN917_c1_g1_i11.p1 TRINITY_DN917_c1_g1~~TRINITY_DN917_c1_g1_i11.p1  ORF type:complete len:137 (-),score=16.79 TRINITY_DN917_c1_g1_i11:152-562(-)
MPRSGKGYKTVQKLPPDVELPTETSIEQRQVLRDVRRVFQAFEENVDDCEANFPLQREATAQYIIKSLEGLSSGFASLDASRPWLCYWMLNALGGYTAALSLCLSLSLSVLVSTHPTACIRLQIYWTNFAMLLMKH